MSLFFYPLLHSSPHHPPGVQRCVVAAVQECGVVHRGRRGGPEGAYHWWVLFPGCFGVVLCVCVGVPQLLPISNFHPPQPHYLLTTATLSSYHSHTIFLPQPHYLLTTPFYYYTPTIFYLPTSHQTISPPFSTTPPYPLTTPHYLPTFFHPPDDVFNTTQRLFQPWLVWQGGLEECWKHHSNLLSSTLPLLTSMVASWCRCLDNMHELFKSKLCVLE